MLLYDIFLEIDARHLSSSYQDTLLTRTELELALKKAISCYRVLQNPEKTKAYRHFLEFFEQRMRTYEKKPVLPLLLEALLDEHCPLKAEMVCEAITQLFYLNTQHQDDALGFALMGEVFVDQPIAFAAFLRCLCLHGLSEQQILSTHLLHHFFRYHLGMLEQEDHPITTFFQLLMTFPETIALARAAQTVTSQERGFTSYALNGRISSETLTTVEKKIFSLKFTSNEQNLTALHALFGSNFLLATLSQWQTERSHPIWIDCMSTLFNRSDIISQQLPAVLSRLHENLTLQQALAEILEKDTLHQLVLQRNADVLCLISFRPEIVEMIQQQDLAIFLKNIRQNSSSTLSLIIGLLSLSEAVKHAHIEITTLVFQHLLSGVLEEPYILEDEPILRKIRQLSLSNNCICEHIKQYEAQLEMFITIQAQGELAAFDYITIEDLWRHGSNKIQTLQEITNTPSAYPTDKWALYLRLAHALFQYHAEEFNLTTIATLLNVTMDFDESNVTEYERLVIELLAAIDDESFRNTCTKLLDERVQTRDWRKYHYGDLDFYQRAIQASNIGYIEWLQKNHISPTTSYDVLSILAAQHHQWPIVCHLYTQHHLKLTTVNLLLHTAVNQGAANAILLLWKKEGMRPSAKQIEQTFLLAVRKNEIDSINNMIYCLKMPPDKVIAKAFKLAISLEHYQVAKIIVENFEGKLLRVSLEGALLEGARNGNSERLNHLIPLSHINMIDTAFLITARTSQLTATRCFFEQKTLTPRVSTVKRAWNEAKKHQRREISAYLAHLFEDEAISPPSPTKKRTSSNEQEDNGLHPIKAPLTRATSWCEMKINSSLDRNRFFSSSPKASSPITCLLPHSISLGKLEGELSKNPPPRQK